jgi:hypothetical protein
MQDDGFEEAFKSFEEDEKPTVEPPKEDPAVVEVPKAPEVPEDEKPSDEAPKEGEDGEDVEQKPADESKEEEKSKLPTPPAEAPKEEEKPAPLTKDDLKEIISNVRNEERDSGKKMETATNDVLEAYYPEGLSNTLVDEKTGKELKSPQDVVDSTDGNMSLEEAQQWLMNEQFKLDQDVSKIRQDAQKIAETTVKFQTDGAQVLEKYEPLFKWQPSLQEKIWKQYKGLVKADEKKNVVLSAPDMMEFYDLVLEPYKMAYEHSQDAPATNPTPAVTPPAPKPGAEDRMDVGGDGGTTAVNDPNDFAQQVSKELAKGI